MAETTNIFLNLSLKDLLIIIGIVAGTWILLQINKAIFRLISRRTTARKRYKILFLQPIIRLILFVGATVGILSIVTKPSEVNIITILAALSIALGFAFQEYISSLIAGVVILYENPYRVGDWIEIDGIYGEVEAVGLRSIKLRTPDDTEVYIPQLKIWDTAIYNANAGSQSLMCVTNFYLAPNHDPNVVNQIFRRVTLTSPYTLLNEPIEIIATEHPYGTHYRIKSYPIDPRDQFKYMTDLTFRVKTALKEKKIDFANVPMSISQS